jgi:hypothetical protein
LKGKYLDGILFLMRDRGGIIYLFLPTEMPTGGDFRTNVICSAIQSLGDSTRGHLGLEEQKSVNKHEVVDSRCNF